MIVTAAGCGLVWYYRVRPVIRRQEQEAGKLNAILNSIADGVIMQDLAGKIETTNPSAQQLIDALTTDFISASSQMDPAKQQAQVEARLDSLFHYLASLEPYKTQNIEIGRYVLSTRAAPVTNQDGEPTGNVVVLRDITYEVEAKKLKDDFVTTVSHELRTPLSVIKGYNDLLRMNAGRVAEEYRPNFFKSLDNIDKHIDDLLDLIEKTLDLTQINAGALGIDRERLNLSRIIATETAQWRERMTEKQLTYQLHLPDEPIWVEGDENRLVRVINNLLKNAHSYTLPGGVVEVSVHRLPEQVLVNITDTGVGISKRDQPFLFSRFYRAIHAEGTYEVSGAGLGLFLSKAIIEAHGGQIWFESEVKEGSTFSFTLPVATNNTPSEETVFSEYPE
jgi:signal transduction histidine kinase